MTLLDLLKLMRKHLSLMIVLPIVCALLTAGYAWFMMPNEYTASVSMYVLTKSSDTSDDALSSTDLSASQMLTNDVATLIKSNRVLDDTATKINLGNLDEFDIAVTNQATTRVITISVTGTSAQSVAIVANQLAETTDEVAKEVMDVKAVNTIDKAYEPVAPSGPSRALYTAVAFLAGIFLAIAIIVLMDVLDTRVRDPKEIEELLEVPVIGRMPVVKG